MELIDLANLIDRNNQIYKAELNKLSAEIAQIKPEIARLNTTSANASSQFSIGQSLERAGYNLSVSLASSSTALQKGFIWAGVAFGVTTGTLISVLLTVLLGKGIY